MSQDPDTSAAVAPVATGAHWMAFWRYVIDKHQLPEATASAYRTAARRVLDVEDDPDLVDVEALDVDEILSRFRNKNRTKLTPASFETYESRFRRGREMYLSWRRHDSDWAVRNRRISRSNTKKPVRSGSASGRTAETVAEGSSGAGTASAAPGAASQLFDYPVALMESGITAILRLPSRYTEADADRMAALIHALAVKTTG